MKKSGKGKRPAKVSASGGTASGESSQDANAKQPKGEVAAKECDCNVKNNNVMELATKKELTTKKEPIAKKEPITKDELTTTKELTTKEELHTKKEPITKDELTTTKELTTKEELTTTKDPKSNEDPKIQSEPDKNIESSPSSMTAIEKLRRFCFIGSTDTPVYATPTLGVDRGVESMVPFLVKLCSEVGETELVECLSSLLGKGPNAEHLPRFDEPLLVLAVFLSTQADEEKRKLVRNKFPDLIAGDRELLLFVQLVKRVQKRLERKTPFSRTVRKAVLDWYGKQSLDRLLDLWSMGDGSQWSAHKDLLHKCHYSDKEFPPDIAAALRLLSTHPKELSTWPSYLSPLVSVRSIIDGILKLRLLQDPKEALPLVQNLCLSSNNVPVLLFRDSKLARFLMPHMSYDDLLDRWQRLSRYHHQVRPLMELLLDEKKLKAGNVHPVRLLLEDMHFRKPKKVGPISVGSKKPTFLHSAYETSFGLNKAVGRRLHITLNLEECYMGKYLTGRCRSLKYLDAVVALAFGYFHSDPKVTVQFWSDRSGQLKTLPWTKEMTLAEATACCETQKVPKIKQSLMGILEKALADEKNTYDLFLVLVPSATRGNPEMSSKGLAALLDVYRKKRSSNAKFIVVSLRQHHASMEYSSERNENLLELCSLDEHTPQLINAFARKKFY